MEPEKIITLTNAVEASLVEPVLKEKSIPFTIVSYHDPALDGLWQAQKGWGYIQALPEYREEIVKICTELFQGSQDIAADDPNDPGA